jgi:DNA-directed RNA polymerase subunit RPC12/RpoP
MAIFFTCEQCGHHVRAEDAHAGRRARCAHCGHKMMVPGTRLHHYEQAEDEGPEPEFRLAPTDDDPPPPPRVVASVEPSEIALRPIEPAGDGGPAPRLAPAADGPRFGAAQAGIPEELLADRAPIPLDPDYAPPTPPGHGGPSWAIMAVKARMYHTVRSILKKIEWFENWLYVVSLVFLMVAIAGLLLEYRPLAHFGAVWVTLSSLLLAALGGIEVVIKPFQYGIFGTSWGTMKKQIRHALGAFIPLAVLIASYFFIEPIRDYFLDTAEARQLKQMSFFSTPHRERNRDGGPAVDPRRVADWTRA